MLSGGADNNVRDSDEISFFDYSEQYCVCYIDMVDSTRVISQINKSEKIAQYYSIFLNSISIIVYEFAGKIIKNTGDGMVCYFPETSNSNNKSAFRNVIECGLTMMAAFRFINIRMHEMDFQTSAIESAQITEGLVSQNHLRHKVMTYLVQL